jgi:hypothetical protein
MGLCGMILGLSIYLWYYRMGWDGMSVHSVGRASTCR